MNRYKIEQCCVILYRCDVFLFTISFKMHYDDFQAAILSPTVHTRMRQITSDTELQTLTRTLLDDIQENQQKILCEKLCRKRVGEGNRNHIW